MRRILAPIAHAAVKTRGSIFERKFRVPGCRLGYSKAIWATAHRVCGITCKVLHDGVRFSQPKTADPTTELRRAKRLLQQLRIMGYNVHIQKAADAAA